MIPRNRFPARRWLIAALATCLWTVSAYADQRIARKWAVVALAKDAAQATEVESGLKKRLSERGADAASLRELFPIPVTVKRIARELRRGGYESLLCVAPRKMIHWSARQAAADPEMVDCLAAYATGVFPSGDPLPVSPFDEDPVVTMDLQDTAHGPFPGHGESPFVVQKGLIRVFGVATGQSLWQGFVEIRVPDNTRTSSRTALVVDAIWKELIKAGVLSPS